MKKLNSIILASAAAIFIACGGGGLSEDFKKEIAEFETAWGTATNSVTAIHDSVQATITSWESMETCSAPDSTLAVLSAETKSQLDSIMLQCKDYSADIEKLHEEIEVYMGTWEADKKAFTDWKDKVEKGEIDVETAKKDMKLYKDKITLVNDWVKQTNEKFIAIKSSCETNCAGYGEVLSKATAPVTPE
jgi:hypothetical protein